MVYNPNSNGAFNGSEFTRPTRRTRQTLVPHPDFPKVWNVEEALVEVGRRHWWDFMFKRHGYTARAYHKVLSTTVLPTRRPTDNGTHGRMYPQQPHDAEVRFADGEVDLQVGRNGERDVLQYAPTGKVADQLNADDQFLVEVFRSHPHLSTFRLVSLWWQNRGGV